MRELQHFLLARDRSGQNLGITFLYDNIPTKSYTCMTFCLYFSFCVNSIQNTNCQLKKVVSHHKTVCYIKSVQNKFDLCVKTFQNIRHDDHQHSFIRYFIPLFRDYMKYISRNDIKNSYYATNMTYKNLYIHKRQIVNIINEI